jgi:hypothetical protein
MFSSGNSFPHPSQLIGNNISSTTATPAVSHQAASTIPPPHHHRHHHNQVFPTTNPFENPFDETFEDEQLTTGKSIYEDQLMQQQRVVGKEEARLAELRLRKEQAREEAEATQELEKVLFSTLLRPSGK